MGVGKHIVSTVGAVYDRAGAYSGTVLILLLLLLTGCGYRLAGKRGAVGVGQTIAVPTFANGSKVSRIEQRISEEVRRELVRRTRFDVISEPSADVVVSGAVLDYFSAPILFNEQGRASSYSISVDLKVSVTDTRTGAVLLQRDRWTFREIFELAPTSTEFVPEQPAAVERLARAFASSLVASLLQGAP